MSHKPCNMSALHLDSLFVAPSGLLVEKFCMTSEPYKNQWSQEHSGRGKIRCSA